MDVLNQRLSVLRKQLDGIFGRFVGAQQAVVLIVAGTFYRRVHDIVETQNDLSARFFEDALGALAGVDIAGENGIGIVENGLGTVGKDDLYLCPTLFDQIRVIIDVVNAGELMLIDAEQLMIAFKRQHIAVGIDARFIDLIDGDQLITHLIGRIGQHEDDLFAAHRDTAQADRKAVAGQDRENHADSTAAELRLYIIGDILNGSIVALRTRYDRLGDRDNVFITK